MTLCCTRVDGYLPADLYGDLSFYLFLSIAYTITGIGWVLLCYQHQHELINLQYWITIILVCAMLEASFIYEHYLMWNEYGTADVAKSLEVFGIMFGVLKRSISRVFVLMVAMGYGTVKPNLGEDTKKILCAGLFYAAVSFIYDISSSMSPTTHIAEPSDSSFMTLVVVGLAAVDSMFYIWTFAAVNELIITLTARKQTLKALLYTRFQMVLYVSCILSIVWLLYSTFFILNDSKDHNWEKRWAVDAMYEIIYLIIFLVMAVLWAPSKNSQRYAYSIELSSKKSDSDSDSDLDGEETGLMDTSESSDFHSNSAKSRQIIGDSMDAELNNEYGGELETKDEPELVVS